jgi:predicted hotdog family 3-hydroxylacyl-ACP dehydratase
MSAGSRSELAGLLPHSGPMLLLERVVSHAEDQTICALDPAASDLFRDAEGNVPGWVALEWMAQCVAAHGGLLARAAGRRPSPGMLVGARRIELLRREFAPGEMLEVEARYAGSAGALASFACALRAGPEVVATGSLSVYVSDALGISAGAGT